MRRILVPILLFACSYCFADTLVMRDGTRRQGTLESASSTSVTFKEGDRMNTYMRSDIQAIEINDSTSSTFGQTTSSTYGQSNTSAQPTYAQDNSGTSYGQTSSATTAASARAEIPAGTTVNVLTNENIDSSTANVGQMYSAQVTNDVTGPNGQVVIPRGSAAELVIRNVEEPGKVTGNSELVLALNSVTVNGRRNLVSTKEVTQQSNEGLGKNKRTATMVGGGAVLGTLIGAIAGGGKGAAIGAITGAAAGAGAQVLTRGKNVKVPAETKLNFQLDQPMVLQPAS